MEKRKVQSFRRLLLASVFCVALPLAVMLIVNSLYSIRAFNQKIADSNQRTVDTYVGQIENQLSTVDDAMAAIAAGSADFRTLSAGAGQLQAHLSSYALLNQIKPMAASYPAVSALFIYSRPSHAERDVFTEDFTYPQKQAIREYIRAAVREDSYSTKMGWRWAVVDEAAYLLRFYGGRGTYLVAMAPLDKLMSAAEWEPEREVVASFTTLDHEPLTQREFIEAHSIDLGGGRGNYYLSGSPQKYMIIGRQLNHADCSLVFLVGGAGYLETLDPVQIWLLALSLLTVLLLPLLILHIDRMIVSPVEELKRTMTRIREGDLQASASAQSRVLEFWEMSETFNAMMGQIKDLKIESYEKEIENQKAELRYLQLQMRPHFFLNGLKSLYAMAQQREYEKIQRMTLAFSRHIRYIFRDSMDFVPLGRELEHVQNFMELQALSEAYPPWCTITADPRLREFPIPPFSILTFVENSVKHKADPDLPLEIDVKATVLESDGQLYMDLAVSDSGRGFSEEVLQEINGPFQGAYTEHHVGLNNVKRRMRLIYGDQVMYAFFNTNPGCVSEILIPIRSEELGKEEPK